MSERETENPPITETPAPPREQRPKKKGENRILIIEIKAALASFAAILPPVFMTMLLSAFIVLYITPDAQENIGESPAVVFDEGEADNNSEAAGFGLLNALILIGAITVMTFVIVLLIYLKCEKIFAAYLVFALIMLMGFTTALMALEGLQTYNVPTDIITLSIFFFNYAITGAVAIFSYEGGLQGPDRVIPYSITQVYLVLVSVVMAWLVTTIFPEFTVWLLLVALALYDLCAVLTPCGPLNCLIKVVTKRQEEEEKAAQERGEDPDAGQQKQMIPGLLYEVNTGRSTGMNKFRNKQSKDAGAAGALNFSVLMSVQTGKGDGDDKEEEEIEADKPEEGEREVEKAPEREKEVEIVEEKQAPEIQEMTEETAVVKTEKTPKKEKEISELTAEERAARLESRLKRRAMLEAQLLEELKQQSNLKLGLGDFVFYSVLTAKAAEFGFIAFVAVATCVLCGLCGTLILLSVYQKALPALPISIFIGVITYLFVFAFVSPFSDGLVLNLATV